MQLQHLLRGSPEAPFQRTAMSKDFFVVVMITAYCLNS